MSSRDKLITQTFNVIIDKLIVEMEKRKKAYLRLNEIFSFLTDESLKDEEIKIKANNLVEAYKIDLESSFVNEFLIFKSFREGSFSVLKRVMNWQRSTIGQEKLSSLSIRAIEHELLQEIDTE